MGFRKIFPVTEHADVKDSNIRRQRGYPSEVSQQHSKSKMAGIEPGITHMIAVQISLFEGRLDDEVLIM